MGRLVENLKYGGAFTFCLSSPNLRFDNTKIPAYCSYAQHITNEELLTADWSKRPAGNGESTWTSIMCFFTHLEMGCLAESWELPDDKMVIFHIRKGVHYHDKPLANGREMTAS